MDVAFWLATLLGIAAVSTSCAWAQDKTGNETAAVNSQDPAENTVNKCSIIDEDQKKKNESTDTAVNAVESPVLLREVTNVKATPRVGGARLEWDLNLPEVDHIEIFGKYFNDQHFWRYEGFSRFVRAVELPLDPLCPVSLRVHTVFRDGSWSKGVAAETVPLHKNVIYDEFEGRTLLIYLPDGYCETDTIYPVIYMHDGQNLFAERLAFVEDWQIDRAMDRLIRDKKMPEAVVVGIYNSSKRAEEYTPFADRRFGGGKARDFSAFVVEKIIPYIEKKYRVSNRREDRAVMGSSFGGILSLWMGYTYPDVFSAVGAISPSMWIADGAMLEELERQDKKPIKIWIDQGTAEWSTLTRNTVNVLISKGYKYGEELVYYEVKDAPHNEVAWGQRVECPFILFKGKPKTRCLDIRLDVQVIRMFSVGPREVIINPIGHFDNGIWYSLYTSAEYFVEGSDEYRKAFNIEEPTETTGKEAEKSSETPSPVIPAGEKSSALVTPTTCDLIANLKTGKTLSEQPEKPIVPEKAPKPVITATIDHTGTIQFNKDRIATIVVRFGGIVKKVTVTNPNPPEPEPEPQKEPELAMDEIVKPIEAKPGEVSTGKKVVEAEINKEEAPQPAEVKVDDEAQKIQQKDTGLESREIRTEEENSPVDATEVSVNLSTQSEAIPEPSANRQSGQETAEPSTET